MGQRLFALEETERCLMRVLSEGRIRLDTSGGGTGGGEARLRPASTFAQKRSAVSNTGASPFLDPVLIRLLLLVRSLRNKHLESDFDQDPAWTMLLELAWAELQGNQMSITSLCIGSGVEDTTAHRYLKVLEEDGFIVRRSDARDGRRCFVELSPGGRRALSRLLQDLRVKAARLLSDFV